MTKQQILESHFGSEYYTIKEIEPHILAAMEEYAAPLESRIRELEDGLRDVRDAFSYTHDNPGLRLIDKLLTAAPDRDKGWVSVEKELPEILDNGKSVQLYLGWVGNSDVQIGRRNVEGLFVDMEGWEFSIQPTHWMFRQLPAPPQTSKQ